MCRIPVDRLPLLTEVLTKHRPDLVPLINSGQVESLSQVQREELIEAVHHEMMTTGLGGTGQCVELNHRGESLDELIGILAKM